MITFSDLKSIHKKATTCSKIRTSPEYKEIPRVDGTLGILRGYLGKKLVPAQRKSTAANRVIFEIRLRVDFQFLNSLPYKEYCIKLYSILGKKQGGFAHNIVKYPGS